MNVKQIGMGAVLIAALAAPMAAAQETRTSKPAPMQPSSMDVMDEKQ